MFFLRVLLATLVAAAACGKEETRALPWVPDPLPELGAVVARVGEVPIFAAEVAAQAGRSGKAPREALEELIAFHVLAERLRASWPPTDQQARTLHQEVLVQRLLEREFEAKSRPEDMPDAEVRKIYDAARDKFVHGRGVEVAVLQVTVGRKATPELRAECRKTATELGAHVHKREARTPEDFRSIAADPKWANRRVKYYRFVQELEKPYSVTFGTAVHRLKKPGETTPVIEDSFGFYLARYVTEVPPRNVTFEQARQQLRDGYYPRWRQARFEELNRTLAAQHTVELNLAPITAAAAK